MMMVMTMPLTGLFYLINLAPKLLQVTVVQPRSPCIFRSLEKPVGRLAGRLPIERR